MYHRHSSTSTVPKHQAKATPPSLINRTDAYSRYFLVYVPGWERGETALQGESSLGLGGDAKEHGLYSVQRG